MDLRDLRYFRAAAELGHLGKAARVLGLTQPAVTKSIQRLEREIDCKLFMQEGRQLRLTPAGELLLERTLAIEMSLRHTVRDVQRKAHEFSGRIRLGASPLVAETLFPRLCAAIGREMPGLILELVIESSDRLRAELLAADLDLAVYPILGHVQADLDVEVLLDDELVVACAADHPLLASTEVSLEDLAKEEWVLPGETTFVRRRLNEIFVNRGLPAPSCRIEVNSVLAAPGLIGTSRLLGFTSRLSLHAERFARRLGVLPQDDIRTLRRIGLVTRASAGDDAIRRQTAAIVGREASAILRAFA